MLADLIPTWQSTIAVAALAGTALSLIFSGLVVFYMKRQADLMARQNEQMSLPAVQTITPQPLQVEITEELHQKFAGKEDCESLMAGNTQRHAEIFRRIEHSEAQARKVLAEAIRKIDADRERMLEKFNQEFTFIRESLSAINTELKLKRRE